MTLAGVTASAAVVAAPSDAAPAIRIGPLSHRTVSHRPTGIDVSIYQHPHGARIRWRAVARRHRFAFIEATGGAAGRRSPYYRTDAAGAHRAGLAVGAYSFADMRRPVRTTARADARHFARVVGRQTRRGTLPPVLDVESNDHRLSSPQIVRWVRIWAATVRHRTGRRPIVYTYPYFWSHMTWASQALARSFRLWVAAYTLGYGSWPLTPPGWHGWTFWQAAGGNGRSVGVPGECDLDVFNGSARQLNRLALRGHARAHRGRHRVRSRHLRRHRTHRQRLLGHRVVPRTSRSVLARRATASQHGTRTHDGARTIHATRAQHVVGNHRVLVRHGATHPQPATRHPHGTTRHPASRAAARPATGGVLTAIRDLLSAGTDKPAGGLYNWLASLLVTRGIAP